jgi:hypothetical protein
VTREEYGDPTLRQIERGRNKAALMSGSITLNEFAEHTAVLTVGCASKDILRPMSEAPRDGSAVRLHLRDGTDFVGYYTDRWWGWVPLLDPWPLIRGDVRFTGWEPVADEEVRRIRQQSRGRVPPAAVVATEPAPRPVIVKARKPRPRR